MAKRGEDKKKKKFTKQAILELLEGNEIDLSMSDLTSSTLPIKELGLVPRGTRLDLSRNQLDTLPDSFCTLKHLVELDLSKNQLKELPESFGGLALLQRLDLYSNNLVSLPLGFWQLKKLKWLDLKNNPNLEPELAKAAGTCVDEKECKECAQNVLAFMKRKSAEVERARQRRIEEEKELQRREEEERRKKAAEAKKQKAELKQRRREEHARQQAEKAAQEQREREQMNKELETDVSREDEVSGNTSSQPRCSCGCILRLIFGLLLVLTFVLVGGTLLCDQYYGSEECRRLWREFIILATQDLESLGIKLSGS